MHMPLKASLLFKVTLITFFAAGWPATVWGQTVARDFTGYVGRPVNELLANWDVPAKIELTQPSALLLRYDAVEMHEQAYDVAFAVTGPWVEIARAVVADSAALTPAAVSLTELAAAMGKSRAELVMLARAPKEQVAFEWDGFLLENLVFEVVMEEGPWRLSCDLENGRLVAVALQYGGEMPLVRIRDFVLELDAKALALLNEPVWCRDDSGYDETDPAASNWRYNRLAADERFGVLFTTLVTPETGHLFLDLTYSDLNAKGFVTREFAASHLKAIADNWYMETSRYLNSGNTARLQMLLERRQKTD